VVLATTGIGLLTFGLIKGPNWGWTTVRTDSILAVAAVLLGLFAFHCRHSRAPLVHPELFRARPFRGASLVAIFFSSAFGAMLLSVVLWEQGAWGWSALRAGLAIAPGPLVVPFMSLLVAGPLIRRWGPAAVIAVGSLAFGAGVGWWALAVTASSDYLFGLLGGMILSGVGVGLTLPTLMATATASLPPHAFATGSAVINMIRQTGLALGVAVLVAVLGTGGTRGTASLVTFEHAWWLTAAISFAGAIPALVLVRHRAPAATPAGAAAA
jgi:hypothetical protein